MDTQIVETFDQVTNNTKNTTESAIEFGEMIHSLLSEASGVWNCSRVYVSCQGDS